MTSGLDWADAEYELLGELVRAELGRAGGWDPKLHPRDHHGEFARTPGSGGTKLADSGPGSVETRQVAVLAEASNAAEQALSAQMQAMDAQHRAEMAKITAEMRSVQQEISDAKTDEEKRKGLKKLVHHVLMLALTGLSLFLATKYDAGTGAEIAATLGPLGLQGLLDFVRKA